VRLLATVSPLTFLYPDLSMASIYTYGWLIFLFCCVLYFFFYIFIFSPHRRLWTRLIFIFSIIMIIHAINITSHDKFFLLSFTMIIFFFFSKFSNACKSHVCIHRCLSILVFYILSDIVSFYRLSISKIWQKKKNPMTCFFLFRFY